MRVPGRAASFAVVAFLVFASGAAAAVSLITSPTASFTKASQPCGEGVGAPGNCLVAVSFVDDHNGFGIYDPNGGASGLPLEIAETADAGASWQVVGESPITSTENLATQPILFFTGREDGFVYDDTSTLYSTRDGGKSWIRKSLPGDVVDLANSAEGIWLLWTSCPVSPSSAPCSAGAETTEKAGRRFETRALPYSPYRFAQVGFGLGDTVFLGLWAPATGEGDPGELLVSHDGGSSWSVRTFPCPQGYRLGGQLSVDASSDTIWMLCLGQGSGGTRGVVIYRSTDEGVDWIAESSYSLGGPTGVREGAPSGQLEKLAAVSATGAFALTRIGGLEESTDGGITWRSVGPGAMQNAVDGVSGELDVVDSDHAWVVAFTAGPRGVLGPGTWRTVDGGANWEAMSSP